MSIVQIYNSIDEFHVDLTVGLENDQKASAFLNSGKKILLPSESGELKEYSPVIANVFKRLVTINSAT